MRSTLDPTLDIVFKMLLAAPESRDVLTALVTAVLKPTSPITDIEVLDPEIPKDSVRDKGIVLDLRVRLGDGTLLDLEMQADKRPAFRKRAVLYWARMFSSQLERGGEYGSLRPAILVLFLDYDELDSKRLHSLVRLTEVHDQKVFSDVLQIHVVELPNLKRMQDAERVEEGRLVGWARFFSADTDSEVEEAAMSDPMIAKAKGALEKLSADPAALEQARQRELALFTYRLEMTTAREEGFEVGLERGRQEGSLRLIQRRLGRPLTDTERTTVLSRLDKLGPDRMDEVGADFDRERLAAWLADPAAT